MAVYGLAPFMGLRLFMGLRPFMGLWPFMASRLRACAVYELTLFMATPRNDQRHRPSTHAVPSTAQR